MAARDGDVGYDQLHHFIAADCGTPRRSRRRCSRSRQDGRRRRRWLIVDDTALPKKGAHSVGVASQYASSLGRPQLSVAGLAHLGVARSSGDGGPAAIPPESWTDDPERMARVRVPEDRRTALTKPEIAIEEIDRVIASGARFGCVLADSGYGSSGLPSGSERARSAVGGGLSRRQNVYPSDVALAFPIAKAESPQIPHP